MTVAEPHSISDYLLTTVIPDMNYTSQLLC